MTEQDVRCALNRIQDPCSLAAGAPAGIDELGLLSEISVHNLAEGAHVRVGIRLTDPVCMMGAAFLASARDLLAGLDGVASAEVWLDERSDWSPANMAPAYRARLEQIRAARRR
ncbi:MAG: DUF59 domain-containing protein [Solirubrobacterales bacterium]|nr:DUF59 domain-containing protein [Solirubrobacterales bacterium]MBV9800127.1 DUF59 domain-containing protein [Solirubrobacterales bacterium]